MTLFSFMFAQNSNLKFLFSENLLAPCLCLQLALRGYMRLFCADFWGEENIFHFLSFAQDERDLYRIPKECGFTPLTKTL